MEKELTWKEAIVRVFTDEQKPLHFNEIADIIAERKYRKNLGATPNSTVAAQLTTDIKKNPIKSNFIKIDKGLYALRDLIDKDGKDAKTVSKKEDVEKLNIVNAFGIYWDRNSVDWKTIPDVFGIQQQGATPVNFKDQIGVYLLYDNREIIYVGQAIEQSIGKRLQQHTSDRLSGRWNRFSWFGFYSVDDKGNLQKSIKNSFALTPKDIGDLLEAILIESVEPRQNRKRGNSFDNIEFLQYEDPELTKKKMIAMVQKF